MGKNGATAWTNVELSKYRVKPETTIHLEEWDPNESQRVRDRQK